jgi:hypothetical protein
MDHKLRVLVRLDIDGGTAWIEVGGNVTARSVQALYVVAKRANALMQDLNVVLDLRRARVGQDPLEALQRCAEAGLLPPVIDPAQAPCSLSILSPAMAARDLVAIA